MLRGLQTRKRDLTTTRTTRTFCDCQEQQGVCKQRIRIKALPAFRDFLEYHAANYQVENPHVTIDLYTYTDEESYLTYLKKFPDGWEGAIIPAHFIGSMVDILEDWNEYEATTTSSTTKTAALDWTQVLPFFRNQLSTYGKNRNITAIPIDGRVMNLYYRKDFFQEFNRNVPRTWEEYTETAQFFHGQIWKENGNVIYGSCVSRTRNCKKNAYWTSMVLSSMTQALGTSSGFFVSPNQDSSSTTTNDDNDNHNDPPPNLLFQSAMQETLRYLGEQVTYGHPNELMMNQNDCNAILDEFETQNCAMTYHWDNSILLTNNNNNNIGVAPTPGSKNILHRSDGQLKSCTTSTCPFANYYDDIGLVNKAPYSAFGGWMAGVSSASNSSKAVMDFFSYVSNSKQSLQDVLPVVPNSNSDVSLYPYRYNHTNPRHWIETNNGLDSPQLALEYTDAIQEINSENAVLDLRIPQTQAFYDILEEEVYSYLTTIQEKPYLKDNDDDNDDAKALRGQVTASMEQRIQAIIQESGTNADFLGSYRQSLGLSSVLEKTHPLGSIDEHFRDAAWGLSGIICLASFFLIVWTVCQRKNRVMKAFQPFLLIQCAVGLFLSGASIIPLGYDEASYSVEMLDRTCMIGPWLYVIGFTIFFSSVYCKIGECMKIFQDPNKTKVLFVPPRSVLKFTLRLLLLNGSILIAWTFSDPLKWERSEFESDTFHSDGSTQAYGTCSGEHLSVGFSVILYLLNISLCFIGILRAFKCRLLVLEYREMEWLTLSLLPFLECWLIGGPVVALTRDRPTVLFTTLALTIAISSIFAGMAIFAPKDHYIRKFRDSEPLSRKDNSSAGILVLKHPTFESQKELEKLQLQVNGVHSFNTELEIEIRGLKERFRQMSKGDKFSRNNEILREVIEERDIEQKSFEESKTAKAKDEELAALEFARVWKMPDDEEDESEHLATSAIPGSLHSFRQPITNTMIDNQYMALEQQRSTPPLATEDRDAKKLANGIEVMLGEEDTAHEESERDGEDPFMKRRDMREINRMIKSDDLEALETKAELLAKSWKAKLNDSNDDNESASAEAATESSHVFHSVDPDSSLEEDPAELIESSFTQEAPNDRREEEVSQREIKSSKGEAAVSNVSASPNAPSKKLSVSFKNAFETKSPKPAGYGVGDWFAKGDVANALADFSDSSSFSSHTDSFVSTTSMEATTRASALDTSFGNEIDTLVAKKDWDGIQLAAQKFESSQNIQTVASPTPTIEVKKRRKRELEAAWRSNAFTSGSNHGLN